MKLGARLCVVLTDFSLIKTAMSKAELSGRPDYFTFRIFMYFMNLGKFLIYIFQLYNISLKISEFIY